MQDEIDEQSPFLDVKNETVKLVSLQMYEGKTLSLV